MTGYDRDRFGQAWLDADRNGCDTRNDMLRRDLHPSRPRGRHERVRGDCGRPRGPLHRPGASTSSGATATLVDIDHVVALGNAWVSGAFRWAIRERAALPTTR